MRVDFQEQVWNVGRSMIKTAERAPDRVHKLQIISNLTTDSSDSAQDLCFCHLLSDKQVTESSSRIKLALEVTKYANKTRTCHQIKFCRKSAYL